MAGAGEDVEAPAGELVAVVEAGAELVPVVILLGKAALDVGVAEEGDRGGHLLERSPGVAHAEDVLILVERGAVDAGDAGLGGVGKLWVDGALGGFAEPEEVVGGEFVVGPLGGGAGGGVEVQRRREAAADAVVVAADNNGGDWADAVEDLVGTAAVADHVAEVPELVPGAGGGEDGFKSFEVGVDVGEDESAHGRGFVARLRTETSSVMQRQGSGFRVQRVKAGNRGG